MAKYLIQPLLEGGGADMIPLNNLGDHVTVTLALIDIDIDTFIMINIINIKGWAIWPVPSPELQLLSPTFLRSPDCSLSSWIVVVRF